MQTRHVARCRRGRPPGADGDRDLARAVAGLRILTVAGRVGGRAHDGAVTTATAVTAARDGGRGTGPFERALALPGWSDRSSWGYDATLECYWAELWRRDVDQGPAMRISPAHLVPTITGLARAVALTLGVRDVEAYLALVA